MQGIDPRATAGQLSPDGMWRWNGVRWELVANPAVPATTPAARTSRRSLLATVAGIQAFVATPFVLAGCIFPYIYYSDTSSGPSTASVFNSGYSGGLWYAAEPVTVIVLGIVAGAFLIGWQNWIVRAIGAGALLALGLQTFMLFVGYVFGQLSYGTMGAGGPLGTFGGALLIIAGALAAAGVLNRPAAATP